MFVIVPDHISDEIYKRIDIQLKTQPQLKEFREDMYHDLLKYFDEHGTIPDFTVEPDDHPYAKWSANHNFQQE